MNRCDVSASARLDAERVFDFLGDKDPAIAARWLANLFATYEFLAQQPLLGHKRTDFTDKPVLFWTFSGYVIICRVEPSWITIVGVLHGSRDIPVILQARLP